ncbi:MAG: hypothetical protein ABIJ41_04665 [Candidatus Omnitrophota bacterium]
MRTFLIVLIVIFIIAFIGQQSHFIQKKTVLDRSLATQKDEYHVNWNNLKAYLASIPDKIMSIPDQLKKKPSRKRPRR